MKEFDIISIGGGSGGNRYHEPGWGARSALLSLKKNNWVAPVSTEDVCLKDYVVWCTNCRSYSRLWTRLWIYF